MLLDGGLGLMLPQLLNISCHDNGSQLGQGDTARFTPARESGGGSGIGGSRVAIADIGGEELDEAASSASARVGEQSGHTPGGRSQGPAGMVMICKESIGISIA